MVGIGTPRGHGNWGANTIPPFNQLDLRCKNKELLLTAFYYCWFNFFSGKISHVPAELNILTLKFYDETRYTDN